mmetsp:Transcript_8044/g.12425  ORF Transcript_8044/g.12425 Transcript_8044/m.12425 type:complete len:118 (+) Transcript_8044:48-401(+)|eukprot:CAMPEP_0118695728 /NCGR_PEP_ID=MMETSP0800-20121206/13382_1 /TAXON_ID=210618 ORGANISM="Striatella unipunctata, Strain CCMP2910" /NCGR_SAMPLE_ID=MMETSP0800 /ASSEMBLY_ACC=CAM_ASM_000638 /LENGTH=117 /DNA_ID=CAMNT_0006594621 /DNA_START=45 /DNA_END=398 /DNA_ORIENTATION=+
MKLSTVLCFICSALLLAVSHGFAPNTFLNRASKTQSPSALSANKGVNIEIEVGEGEDFDVTLRRFKRAMSSSGHLFELRHRRYFENSQEKKKRKKREASSRRRMEKLARQRARQNAV